MTPSVQAAWIAAGSGITGVIIGIAGTVTVAIIGFRSTRDSTAATIREHIEADREQRLWERRAGAYEDAIKFIRHQQDVRAAQVTTLSTDHEYPADDPPVSWKVVEAEVIAYGSGEVISALMTATEAAMKFVGTYHDAMRVEHKDRSKIGRKARVESTAACQLEDQAMNLIRKELWKRTDLAELPRITRGILAIPDR